MSYYHWLGRDADIGDVTIEDGPLGPVRFERRVVRAEANDPLARMTNLRRRFGWTGDER